MHNPPNPKQAVRQMCSLCAQGNELDIQACDQLECPIHEFRPGGQREKNARNHERMEGIRAFCMECSGGDPESVTHCLPRTRLGQVYCPFFTRRPGKLPAAKRGHLAKHKWEDIVTHCLKDRERIEQSLALIDEAREQYMESLR